MKEYVPTEEDLAFAKRFIDWNNLNWGIQRVDACRSEQGELLVVELEDLNPDPSLLELSEETRQNFVEAMKKSLQKSSSDLKFYCSYRTISANISILVIPLKGAFPK